MKIMLFNLRHNFEKQNMSSEAHLKVKPKKGFKYNSSTEVMLSSVVQGVD